MTSKPLQTPTPASDDVSAAFALVLGVLGEEEQRIRKEGARAMENGAYDTATTVIDFARRLLAFQTKVDSLTTEWAGLKALNEKASPEVQEIVGKRFLNRPSTAADRGIEALDPAVPHRLDEDFTYKRPCAFVLCGGRRESVATWSQVYAKALKQLAQRDPALFARLPEHRALITRRGHRFFTRDANSPRRALLIAQGIHAEMCLSANDLVATLRTVLGIFSIPLDACKVFLHQDRDA